VSAAGAPAKASPMRSREASHKEDAFRDQLVDLIGGHPQHVPTYLLGVATGKRCRPLRRGRDVPEWRRTGFGS